MIPELQSNLDQLEAIKADGKAVTAGLSDTQLNWRPGPGRWSIAECLQHLNIGVRATLPAFDRAIAEGREKGKTAPGPFRYGWLSRLMISSMEPGKRRMRTQAIFDVPPGSTYRGAELLPEFYAVRDELAQRVRRADGLDLARVRTISPASRLIRMPLGAYFQFIITHDRRHLWQARQVRNSPGFPQS
jgi:hypothetical protein